MTVTLEPELENEVLQKAAERGQEAKAYLNQLIQAALHQPVPTVIPSSVTTEEFIKSSRERMERAKARNLFLIQTSDGKTFTMMKRAAHFVSFYWLM